MAIPKSIQPILTNSIAIGGIALLLLVVGCGGESNEDKMMRMARARSAANKANAAEALAREKAKAAVAIDQPVATEDADEPEKEVGPTPVDSVLVKREKSSAIEDQSPEEMSAEEKSDADSRPPAGPYSKMWAVSDSPTQHKMLVAKSGQIVLYRDAAGTVIVVDTVSNAVKRKYHADQFVPVSLTYSDERKLVVLGGQNGSVKTFRVDALDGVDRFQRKRILLQEQKRSFAVDTKPIVAVSVRSSDAMLMACSSEGKIRLWESNQQPEDGQAIEISQQGISQLLFAGEDHVVAGFDSGEIKIWNLADLDQLPRTLTGPEDGRLVGLSISADSRRVAAVYDDAKSQSFVWELDSLIDESSNENASAAEPIAVIESVQPNTSGTIDPEGTHLLIGGSDGSAHLWTISSKTHIARFERHGTPIVGVGVTEDRMQFVTLGSDTLVRSWHYPEPNDPSDKRVPLGKSFGSVLLAQLNSSVDVITESDDPLEPIRQHLIDEAASQVDGAIFDLFPADERMRLTTKEQLSLLRRMEDFVHQAGEATAQQLAAIGKTKRGFFGSRSQLAADLDKNSQSSFSDGHPNLVFAAETDFDFRGTPFRPVKMTIAKDRYVYAARRSDPNSRDNDGLGAVASWDFGYSGVKTHDWANIGLDVQELYASPDGRAVFTMPDLFVFSHDGLSSPIASGAQWAVSHRHSTNDDYVFAVGTQGSIRSEEVILRIYDGKKLLADSASTLSEFSAYEGVVTAVAFAKKHRRIAFCVRERASYRLYLADPTEMDPTAFVLVDEQQFDTPYLVDYEAGERSQRIVGPPGITSLEFSPNDDLLVAHGFYERKKYRLSMWQLDWAENDPTSTSGSRPHDVRVRKTYDPWIPDRGPVLEEHGSHSIHFLDRKVPRKSAALTGPRMGSSATAASDVVVIETSTGLQVVKLSTRTVLREIPFVATQWGRPEYEITEDGRWVIMGDDNGTIEIFDLIDGKKISLTVDGRPAHAGPVVGVTLSPPDPVLGFPAYAATVGEENRIKVWDLILPMTTPEASTPLPKPVIESRDDPRKRR